MRIIVGIMLAQALWPAVGRVQGALGCGRAVAEENLHLTLVFPGDLAWPEVEAVHEELAGVRVQPFAVTLAGLDVLGPAARPEAVVMTLRPCPALEALQAKLAHAVRRAGVEIARQRFRPHVTIARFSGGAAEAQTVRIGQVLQRHGDVVLPEWRVEGFHLIRAHPGREGTRHEVLAAYPEG